MQILITGANGFIGQNLIKHLSHCRADDQIIGYDTDSSDDLSDLCRNADFIFHLAGINRPKDIDDFSKGNIDLTTQIISYAKEGKCPPILLTSSTQASKDNPYGNSKAAAEEAIFAYSINNKLPSYVFRLPGVFGKWCRPNYNSVVATFCNNIAHDLPIEIHDPCFLLDLVYIDDVCKAFISALDGYTKKLENFCIVSPVYSITLGDLAKTLKSFSSSRADLSIPDSADELTKKLYATYLSYLPNFDYPLKMNIDARGSFTEIIRTKDRGQVSVNITKAGITKGNHWHHTKNEKFIVVAGEGIIRLRKINDTKIIEYKVSGENIQAIDIPPGYTHNIENLGKSDLITVMWASEPFDTKNPDTYFEQV